MCRNACQFNEPGSQIYKDAKTLKKVIHFKRSEIETGKSVGLTPGKSSERIRNKRLKGGLSYSAITAALQYEDEDEAEEEEEEEEEEEDMEYEEEGEDEEQEEEGEEEDHESDTENPLWILYDTVSNYVNSAGQMLSDPFRKLPSRRYYSDYYKEIENPISLSQIRNRISRGLYERYTQLQADMNIMFENAKTYNRPDSGLYKSAVKLQKVLQAKVQELLDNSDCSNDEDDDEGKRTNNSTPCPMLTMEGDPDSLHEDSIMFRKRGSGTKFKKDRDSVGGLKLKDDKDDKNVALREQMTKRFRTLCQTLTQYTVSKKIDVFRCS